MFYLFKFECPDMEEVSRLFSGEIMADNLSELWITLKNDTLVDSSMYGIVLAKFLLNWTPNWFLSYILNGILSLFTKVKFYRK